MPAIPPIDPDQAQLFPGATEPRTEETCPRWIRDGGGRDDDGPEEPERSDTPAGACAM